ASALGHLPSANRQDQRQRSSLVRRTVIVTSAAVGGIGYNRENGQHEWVNELRIEQTLPSIQIRKTRAQAA
ncbi:thaumatin-like protein, partial [Moniliophthora roreri]